MQRDRQSQVVPLLFLNSVFQIVAEFCKACFTLTGKIR